MLRRFLRILPAVALALTACERGAVDGTRSTQAKDCPGASVEEAAQQYHPRIVRGRVLAPRGKLARRSPFDNWLVGSAQAAPLEAEQTVPRAKVTLYRVGPSGKKEGEVLRSATTDQTGSWCMKLPDGVALGPELMLAASADGTRLRRSLVSPVATDIYSATEALTQLLQEHNVDFNQMPKANYLNIESIADTAVDLLHPVELAEDDTVKTTVEKLGDALAKDDRLADKIAALPKCSL